jgi:hypothetical protein
MVGVCSVQSSRREIILSENPSNRQAEEDQNPKVDVANNLKQLWRQEEQR